MGIKELSKDTAAALIERNSQNNITEDGNHYYIIGKYGLDGYSSLKILYQLVNIEIA